MEHCEAVLMHKAGGGEKDQKEKREKNDVFDGEW